ncbi:YaeQ family protein, partial [Acinetobacter baumannii]|nr:YaeQ family protein [Acinetobacter baumannii]
VKKASARCKTVAIVAYGSQVEDWWKRNSKIKTLSNVQVWQLAPESTAELEQLCERTMQLQLNVMDNEWTLLSDKGQANVVWTQLQ